MKPIYIDIDTNNRFCIEFSFVMETFSISKQVYTLINAGTDKKWITYNGLHNLPMEDLNKLKEALDKTETILLLK